MAASTAKTVTKAADTLACMGESLGFVNRAGFKIAVLFLLLVATAVMGVVSASLLGRSLDAFYVMNKAAFVKNCVLLILSYLIDAILIGSSHRMRLALVEDIAAGQRTGILRSALAMPLLQMEKPSRGDLVSRLTADVGESARILNCAYLAVILVLRSSFASVYMLYLSPPVGLASIASSLIVIWVTSRFNAPLPAKNKAYQKSVGDLAASALNTLEGTTVVRSFCAEDTVARSFGYRVKTVFGAAVSLAKSTEKMRIATTIVAHLPILSAFAFGGYMAFIGKLSPGSVLAMLNLTDYIGILVYLGPRWSEVQKSTAAYARVKEIMSAAADWAPSGTEAALAPDGQGIRVEHLSFEYVPGHPVLDDVSFEVPAGAKVSIVGSSGCGKSTLLRLVAGLYPPPPGAVTLNGLDMHYERLSRGQSEVCYVPQEPFLLSGSVKDNLTLAREQASGGEINSVLAAADSLLFTSELKDGLESQVGERGSLLSGGQRQRLCLARGLLRDAPVLLLDEPTSSLDKESEEKVVSSLYRVSGLTCLIVTHRPRVAEMSDLIFIMDRGRIVESGTHRELLENSPFYRSFCSGETRLSAIEAACDERGAL